MHKVKISIEQSTHSTFRGLWVRRVIGGGGGGGWKCTSAISHAEWSGGVVGSSSAPSVCGIPPTVGNEGVAGVVHAGTSATGERTIFLFLLLLVCTPVGGVPAAAAASLGAVNVAGAAVAAVAAPVTKDRGGAAAAAACVTLSCWVEQAGTCSSCGCRCVCCDCSCCCCSSFPCCC